MSLEDQNKNLSIQKIEPRTFSFHNQSQKGFEFNIKEFRKHLIMKRQLDENISLELAAKEIGISKATLSRLERGTIPDISTFSKACKWLNNLPQTYFGSSSQIR